MRLKQTIKFTIIATLFSVALYAVFGYIGLLQDVSASYSPLNYSRKAKEKKSNQEYVVQIMQDEFNLTWPEVAEALAIIECESDWKPYAIGVNRDSFDLGLWQLNTKWNEDLTRQCAFDVFCSTRYAMRIYQERGNWSAWICN